MALGIPALVSPVGMNTEVVTNDLNGYICNTPEEWYKALEKIIQDPELRIKLGKASRETIEQRYAVVSNAENFLRLFK